VTAIDGYLAEFGVSAGALRARGLVHCAEAPVLAVAEVGADGREHRLTPRAAAAWQELKAAAEGAGETLVIVSAFRSIERQAEIVRGKLRAGQPIDTILEVSALPGFSEHHTGRAVDVSVPGCRPLTLEFEQTAAFRWLTANAGAFGFRLSYPRGNALGYQYEPWHWCHADEAQIEVD
jgi:zinc D-Ala-D-Ala carboxypeptidase